MFTFPSITVPYREKSEVSLLTLKRDSGIREINNVLDIKWIVGCVSKGKVKKEGMLPIIFL